MLFLESVFEKKWFTIILVITFLTPMMFEVISVFKVFDLLSKCTILVFSFLIYVYTGIRLLSKQWKLNSFLILTFLLAITMTVSTIISNGNIVAALKFAISITSISLIIDFYSNKDNPAKFFSAIYWTYLFMMILHVITIVLFPEGISQNKLNPAYFLMNDNQSSIAVILFFILTMTMICLTNNKKFFWGLILLPVMFFCVQSANLKVTILVLIMSVFFNKLLNKKIISIPCFILIGLMLYCIIMDFIEVNPIFILVGKITGRDVTFTGRLYIWRESLKLFKQNIILGIGLQYGEPIKIWDGSFGPHNMYLHMLMYGGIVSFILFLTIIIKILINLMKRFFVKINRYYMCAILAMCVYFLVEGSSSPLYYFMILSMVNYSNVIMSKGVIYNERIYN